MRGLSIIALILVVVAIFLSGSFGKPIAAPSDEFREYFKYIVMAVLVGFVGYLAMTRR